MRKTTQLDDLLAEQTDLNNKFEQADETFCDLKNDMKAKVKIVKKLLSNSLKLAMCGHRETWMLARTRQTRKVRQQA